MTPDTIRQAAKVYNADYPEAAAEIDAGTPVLDVAICHADRSASGRRYRLISTYGVRAVDGGFIGAGEPVVITVDRRRSTERMVDTATRRYTRQAAAAGVELVVRNRAR